MDGKLKIISEKCFYQKFRYKTEKRSGKKTHDSDMFKIKLECKQKLLPSKLQLFVFCVCVDDCKILHPNVLIGKKYCSNGVYHLTQILNKDRETDEKGNLILKIPYLYIVRTKNEQKLDTVKSTLENVPETFKNMKDEDYYKNIKTDCVKLCIVLKVNDQYYSCVSNKISHHDGGENVTLNITRLSSCAFSADEGGEIIIMTEDKHGPDIKAAEYEVYVETDQWISEKYRLIEQDISYKRVIVYNVPAYGGNDSGNEVNGKIVLRCRTNNSSCSRDIIYKPCYNSRKRKAPFDNSEGISKKQRHERGKQMYERMFEDNNSDHVASDFQCEASTSMTPILPTLVSVNGNGQGERPIPQLAEDEDTSLSLKDYTTSEEGDKTFCVNEAGGSFQTQSSIQHAVSEDGSSLKENLLDSNYVTDYWKLDSVDQRQALAGIAQFIEQK